MGKFESYPEASALNDNDITLYNKNTVTHKITFIRLVNLIKDKIAQTGLVTSITTGAGLVGGSITSSGNIKCKLKSETVSSLSSANVTTTVNRQYAVGLDREGYLSVNIPWDSAVYQSGTAIDINNNVINVILDNTYTSGSTVKAASAKAVKDTYDNSMRKDGSNAIDVKFNNTLTVGSRTINTNIGINSVSEGNDNIASGDYSHAEGSHVESSGDGSHSEGFGSEYTNSFDITRPAGYVDATWNISSIGNGSHAEGYTSYEEQSQITGIIQSSGNGSHAEGCALGGQGLGVIIADGNGAHAEGYADCSAISDDCIIRASGNGSHAEGTATTASGDYSHAEGVKTKSTNKGTHSEGYATNSTGLYSHAEGYNSVASGNYSHAEGQNNRATGLASHAEGTISTASGQASHAEGEDVIASGTHTHAEGYSTTASGDYSHAEGNGTVASGLSSHAEGYDTAANGDYSHSSGYGVVANSVSQFVHGGLNDKFDSVNLGNGVFGMHPDGLYYTEDTSIEAFDGQGGTVESNIQITLELNKCSMYILATTLYDSNYVIPYQYLIDNTLELISTSQRAGSTDIIIQPLSKNGMALGIDDALAENPKISLTSEHTFMFHLIRIL